MGYLRYLERPWDEPGHAGRWGVYNYGTGKWLDIIFSSEDDARHAARMLTKTFDKPKRRSR